MNNLRRRKNSQFFYFRQRIPTDLVSAYEVKKEVNKSLGTSDLTEAKLLARLMALEFAQEWDLKRRELNLPGPNNFERRSKNEGWSVPFSTLSEPQQKLFLHNVFLKLERDVMSSGLRDPDALEESERQEAAENAREDLACLTGSASYEPVDSQVKNHCQEFSFGGRALKPPLDRIGWGRKGVGS